MKIAKIKKARCAKLFWGRNYVWKLARSAKGRGKREISVGKSWTTTVGIKDREGIINSIEMRARASQSRRRQLEEETLLAASTDIRISEYRAATRKPHSFSWLYSSIPPIDEVFHRCKGRPRGYCLLDIWNPISTIATFSLPLRNFVDAPFNAHSNLWQTKILGSWTNIKSFRFSFLFVD